MLIYPSFPRGSLATIEGDTGVFTRWSSGDTGEGEFHRFRGDMEPPSLYGEFARDTLRAIDSLHPQTKIMLDTEWPEHVFASVQEDGHVLVLNYNDVARKVVLADGTALVVPAYGIVRHP